MKWCSGILRDKRQNLNALSAVLPRAAGEAGQLRFAEDTRVRAEAQEKQESSYGHGKLVCFKRLSSGPTTLTREPSDQNQKCSHSSPRIVKGSRPYSPTARLALGGVGVKGIDAKRSSK